MPDVAMKARIELLLTELKLPSIRRVHEKIAKQVLSAGGDFGAYLHSLRRLRSGPFQITEAIPLERLQEDARAGKLESHLIGPCEALGVSELCVGEESARRLCNGGDVSPGAGFRRAPGTRVIVRDAAGELLALAELRADRRVWPLRVLRPS